MESFCEYFARQNLEFCEESKKDEMSQIVVEKPKVITENYCQANAKHEQERST